MIVIDTNLLIYAYNEQSLMYADARAWLQRTFSTKPVRLPWAVIHAFLRLTTTTRAVPAPFRMSEAIAIVDEWLSLPNTQILEAGTRYWPIFRGLLLEAEVRGPLVTDAHIAALAIEHDATLYTADTDFRRFRGLRFVNPLV